MEGFWRPVGEPELLRDPLAEEASMSWSQPVPEDMQASLQNFRDSLHFMQGAVHALHLQVCNPLVRGPLKHCPV